jgi:hypothetical protein
MSKIKKIKTKGDNTTYYMCQRIKNQVVGLFVTKECKRGTDIVYNVGLAVGKTRKQIVNWYQGDKNYLNNMDTGKNGIKPLKFALEFLDEIEEYVKSLVPPHHNAVLKIHGADERRMNIYGHFLKKRGYECIKSSCDNSILKIIKKL